MHGEDGWLGPRGVDGSKKKESATLSGSVEDRVTHTGIHVQEKKVRAGEVEALAVTIKILNDHDALDLFKGTVPSASARLMQVQESNEALRSEAKTVLEAEHAGSESRHRPRTHGVLHDRCGTGALRVLSTVTMALSIGAYGSIRDKSRCKCGVSVARDCVSVATWMPQEMPERP